MRTTARVGLLFLLVPLVLFFPLLQGEEFVAWDFVQANLLPFSQENSADPAHGLAVDSAVQWAPYNRLYGEHLQRGVIPFYDPWNRLGNPTVGPSWGGTLHPLKLILFRHFPPATAQALLLWLSLSLAGLGSWLFFRQLGAGDGGALFGALAFVFSGHLMAWLPLEFSATVSAGLPFSLYCLRRAWVESRVLWAVASGIILGLVLLSAHAQWALYAALAVALALVCWAWEYRASSDGTPGLPARGVAAVFAVKLGLAVFLFAFLVAAPTLLSLMELSADSERSALGWWEDYTFRHPFRRLLLAFTFLHPGLFGAPDGSSSFYGFFATNANDFQAWTGSLTLILALAALRLSAPLFLRLLWLLALLCAFGTPVYYPLYALVPGMKQMCATRILYLASFAVAGLAAFSFGQLASLSARPRLRRGMVAACMAAALFALIPSLVAVLFPERLLRIGAAAATGPRQLAKVNALIHWWQADPLYFLPILVLILGGLIIHRFPARPPQESWRSRLPALLLFMLLTVEILAYALHFLPHARDVFPPRADLERLSLLASAYRVAQDGASGRFMPDLLKPYRIHDLGGKGPLYPRPVQEYLSRIEGQILRSHACLTRFSSPLLARAGVAWLLSDRDDPPGYPEYLERAVENPFTSPVRLYHVRNAVPRFRAVARVEAVADRSEAFGWLEDPAHDPARVVCAEDFAFHGSVTAAVQLLPLPAEDNRLGCLTQSDAPFYLTVLHYLPAGFRAYLDGRDVPWQRTDAVFAGLVVPAGEHEVLFVYHPPALVTGFALQLSALLLILGMVLGSVIRGRCVGKPASPLK